MLATTSGQAFGLVLPEEALEEAPVPLLVAQDVYDHVLRNVVDAFRSLYYTGVELYGAGLRVDYALDHVHHVRLLLGRLQGTLLGPEIHGARHHPVELLDPRGELLRVPELLLDVLF